MGRHAASNDSTVSPPRLNLRTLRDLQGTVTPLDPATMNAFSVDVDRNDSAAVPINAADLIARFRESGLLSDVSRRTAEPVASGSVNVAAPLALLRPPMLDRAVFPKPVAPKSAGLASQVFPVEDSPASDPTAPVRVADLLNRHPAREALAPRTGHRAAPPRPTRARGRTLSALRPAPSIRVALRPALTVAAIIAAVALIEAPNALTTSNSAGSRAGRSPATTSPATTGTDPTGSTGPGATSGDATSLDPISGATQIDANPTIAADLPRHGGMVTGAMATDGRVSRSTRRAVGAAAHHVPVLKPGQTVPGTWIRPSTGRYTSCFCSRWGSFHAGIDLASKLGTPILAVGDGTVVKAGPASGFGNWVVIQHSNGDVSIYGHMKYFFVHAGQKVKAGEKIAVVGDQGFSTGPHLHFEVHQGGLGGTKINPIPWLKARGIVIGSLSKDG